MEMPLLKGARSARASAEAIAPSEPNEQEIAKLDVTLRRPKPMQPKIEELRAALEQQAQAWRHTLRAEPKVARVLLRRLIGPLTLTDPAFDEWVATLTPALLDGLGHVHVLASPTGTADGWHLQLQGFSDLKNAA